MTKLLIFVTDFADAGVVIPLCGTVAATLLVVGRARLALVWSAVSVAVWVATLLVKLAGYAASMLAPALRDETGLLTASGHVASAASAYGGLICLLVGFAGSARCAGLAGLIVAVVIGATRVMLGEHTVAEAIAGGVIGVCGAASFAALTSEAVTAGRRAALIGASVGALIVLHGEHFTLEQAIAAASTRVVQTLRP